MLVTCEPSWLSAHLKANYGSACGRYTLERVNSPPEEHVGVRETMWLGAYSVPLLKE